MYFDMLIVNLLNTFFLFMLPQKIHYCWFGGNQYSDEQKNGTATEKIVKLITNFH